MGVAWVGPARAAELPDPLATPKVDGESIPGLVLPETGPSPFQPPSGTLSIPSPKRLSETEYRVFGQAPAIVATPRPVFDVSARDIELTVDGLKVTGHVALPVGTSPTEAVVLVPGLMGLDKDLAGQADAFARLGAAAFAVQIYDQAPADRRAAFRAFSALAPAPTLKRIAAAERWLHTNPHALAPRVALCGYGLGADWALRAAAAADGETSASLAAVVLFGGGVNVDAATLKKIAVPVRGFFSRNDGYLTPARVEALEKRLEQDGLTASLQLYDTSVDFATAPDSDQAKSYAASARERTLSYIPK